MPLPFRILIVFTCLICLTLSETANAAGFDLVPNIKLREEYNDNIFFSTTDRLNDFITTISPGLKINHTTERSELGFSGRLDGIYYADASELNAVDQHYFGRLQYDISERLGVLSDAGYIRDSRPDRDILETGLVQGAEPRKRGFFSLGGNYRTTENTSNNLSYRYEQSEFSDDEFADSQIHTLDFQHTWNARRFLEHTIGQMNLGYANADFQTSRVETVSGTFGAAFKAAELWRIVMDLGLRYTVTDLVTAETLRDLSGVGNAKVEYNGIYTYANLAFLHDIREARGRGGTAKRTELTGAARYRLSEQFYLTLSAGYYLNRSDQAAVSIVPVDEQSLRARPGLRYEFTKDLILDLTYTYTRVKDDIDNTTATQNVVFAQLYWQWPIFE